ncbi:MAG: DUF2272 domain-containing protein [Nanoarchaeota archaeon]|nr:DUF2272 domain-containing protein [Nanoarchaeota archaeon]
MSRDRLKSGKRGLITLVSLGTYLGFGTLLDNELYRNKPVSEKTNNKIVDEALEEYHRFNSGYIKEEKLCDIIEKEYYPAGNGPGYSCTKDAWSAAFVSYVMKEADIDFPGKFRHVDYFTEIRDHPRKYDCTTHPMSDILNIDEGDILCKGRSGSKPGYDIPAGKRMNSHCDIVTKVNNDSLNVIGGNVEDTVYSDVVPKSSLGNSKYFGYISCN